MLIEVLKSKIHGARVTECDLDYEGSLAIPEDIIKASGLYVNEKIDVYNVTNGQRFSTYVIKAAEGLGTFMVNGAAAHLCEKGDKIIVVSYAQIYEKEIENHRPKVLILDEYNKIVS